MTSGQRGEALYKANMNTRLNMAVAGCAGRMGRQLVKAAKEAGHSISGGSEAPGSEFLGRDLGSLAGLEPLDIVAHAGLTEAGKGADVWIDFTVPSATLLALTTMPSLGLKAVIVGTTGFNDAQDVQIRAASERLAIVKAGNYSIGVNLLEALVREAASRLDEGWDIEVLETHHRRKVDAPSGTALMLGESAAQGRGRQLKDTRLAPYDGPDAKREPGKIGFSVRRSGSVIGEHEVTFGSDMEVISLSHTALDRAVFAHGAVKAAEWAVTQPPGLYDMSDVLGV